jgi:hypothetical protein
MQNRQIRLRDKRKRNRQKVKANKKKSNHHTPKVKVSKRKSNHQTPKVKANKKKRNRQIRKVKADKKKSNRQRPRFRFDKKKTPKVKTEKKKFWSNKTESKCQNNDKYCHLFQESSQLLNKVSNFLKKVITKLQNSGPIKEKASKRNFNHRIPRFRTDKRKSYHKTLRFRAESKCKNNEEHCEKWSKFGDCDHKVYGPYMKKNCKLSCNLCTG